MKSRFSALRRRPRLRWALFCTILCLTVVIGKGWSRLQSLWPDANRYTPRMTAHQVSQRSLALCANFSNTARLIQEPLFKDERFDRAQGGPRHRPVWLVLCEADGKRYYVEYNDLTGNLISLMPATGVMAHLATIHTGPVIKTAAEAASIAVNHISELRLVPSGTRVVLKANPQLVDQDRAWEIIWKAHPPTNTRPYEVKMVLARKGGAPIITVNRRELAQYVF